MINSKDNKKIKEVKKLVSNSKHRYEAQKFVLEGIKIINEANYQDIEMVLYSHDFINNNKDVINKIHANNPRIIFEELSDEIYCSVSDTKTPQGIMAIVNMNKDVINPNVDKIAKEISDNNGVCLVLDAVNDPGNLGTIIRSALATDIDAVFLSPTCVDLYSPKVVRSSSGAILRTNVYLTRDIKESLEILKNNNIKIMATFLNNKSQSIYDSDFKSSVAVIIGNEANGISTTSIEMADEFIKIPMSDKMESLNAAVATSVIAYEIYRSRHLN